MSSHNTFCGAIERPEKETMKKFNTNLLALLQDAPFMGVMMLTCYSIALLLAPPVGLLLLLLAPAYVNFLGGVK